ncbi:MAG: SDR family NAD(P)-dependent oxidoreductase [Planctomycetes bacterium]|nr:SDR family NAD(P)-dependent oxidoreductase [Planctomycetota bacterium]
MSEWSLEGKVCVVTGANAGIGKAIAGGLAAAGGHVVLACRSLERGRAALAELSEAHDPQRLELLELDQARAASIEAFAEALRARHPQLHVLVNNAGAWFTTRQETPDGLELTFATNALGYFAVTNALLDLLRAGAPARVVNVASNLAKDLDLDDLQFTRRRYSGMKAYAQSKQANRLWSCELAERLRREGITVNAMHPGVVSTSIASTTPGLFGLASRIYFRLRGRSPEEGADTAVYLATSPEVEGKTGRWWVDRREHPPRFADPLQRAALWSAFEALVAQRASAAP